MKTDFEPTKVETNRRVSAIASLDRIAVKELCALHPHDLGKLCASAGLEPTALSHFFAGRRRLPQRYAVEFLHQLGLNIAGELDPERVYMLYVRPGFEEQAAAWILRLFPAGGDRVNLHDEWQARPQGAVPTVTRRGVALFDGKFAAVIQLASKRLNFNWLPGEWRVVSDEGRAAAFLDTENPPSRAAIASLMQSGPNVEEVLWHDPLWNEVKRQTIHQGLTADVVLKALLSHSIQKPTPWTTTLFPMSKTARRRLPKA